jgi:hypothetical protein
LTAEQKYGDAPAGSLEYGVILFAFFSAILSFWDIHIPTLTGSREEWQKFQEEISKTEEGGGTGGEDEEMDEEKMEEEVESSLKEQAYARWYSYTLIALTLSQIFTRKISADEKEA